MEVKIIHLWILAVISYALSVVMGFVQEVLGALIFSVLYLSLLTATKWAK
jgi:hypothetical protein